MMFEKEFNEWVERRDTDPSYACRLGERDLRYARLGWEAMEERLAIAIEKLRSEKSLDISTDL